MDRRRCLPRRRLHGHRGLRGLGIADGQRAFAEEVGEHVGVARRGQQVADGAGLHRRRSERHRGRRLPCGGLFGRRWMQRCRRRRDRLQRCRRLWCRRLRGRHCCRTQRAGRFQHVAADRHAVAVRDARFLFVRQRASVHADGQHRAHVAQHGGAVLVEPHRGLQARDLALLVGQHEVVVGTASDRSARCREQGRRACRHRVAGMFDHCPTHDTSVFVFFVFFVVACRRPCCAGAMRTISASFAWRPRRQGPTPDACVPPR
ncbi:hypothetical protein VVAX_00766 [Variovorax paradoxus]|uniref:Uncharacterized protein n=1 Tax=Variovorax paradoxus TaxID=34073 RepID=A0A679IPI3_VARPD|nr:hypothetical protein VVAX_00766 [Variovorax paradoxus]